MPDNVSTDKSTVVEEIVTFWPSAAPMSDQFKRSMVSPSRSRTLFHLPGQATIRGLNDLKPEYSIVEPGKIHS
jgi:hypothetical protein